MEKLIERYSGQGELIFGENQVARVNYQIDEFETFVSDGLGGEVPMLRYRWGRVTPAVRHSHWHPIVALYSDRPLTLVMSDGRKLKVFLKTEDGVVQGSGDFF